MLDDVQELEEVVEAPAKKRGRKKKQRKVVNVRKGKVSVCGVDLASGEELVITDSLAANEKQMKKLDHAIKNSMLEEV